jgi:hypothetical protein
MTDDCVVISAISARRLIDMICKGAEKHRICEGSELSSVGFKCRFFYC